jgi:hypothetical protein
MKQRANHVARLAARKAAAWGLGAPHARGWEGQAGSPLSGGSLKYPPPGQPCDHKQDMSCQGRPTTTNSKAQARPT